MRRALKRIYAEGRRNARVTASLGAVPFYEAMGFQALRGRIQETRGGLRLRVLEMVRERDPDQAWRAVAAGASEVQPCLA